MYDRKIISYIMMYTELLSGKKEKNYNPNFLSMIYFSPCTLYYEKHHTPRQHYT